MGIEADTYTSQGFPNGLTCADCGHIFIERELIGERPAGAVEEVEAGLPRYEEFTGSAIPIDTRNTAATILICMTCHEKAHQL